MKNINLLVMSLVSAAALSFTSCSSNDDLGSSNSNTQTQVGGFYMTLTVQTPTKTATKTVENKDLDATAKESDVTSGTFYLVDEKGNKVWSKTMTSTDWDDSKIPTQGQKGTTKLQIEVENVAAGATYKVYFLANTTSDNPWASTSILTANTKFANPYVSDNNFAMFNQNNATVNGNGYTVVFTDANKDKTSPATITYKKDASSEAVSNATIKIERITARIDQPVAKSTTIATTEPTNATPAETKAIKDAKKKVSKIEMIGYAISNLANKSYIMQNWTNTTLNIPSTTDGFTHWQPTSEFGSTTEMKNHANFNAISTDAHKDYVFENNSATAPTTMYFEYKVTLNTVKTGTADFADGTFYRYNNVIYSNFQAILDAYKDITGLFDGKTADELKTELKAAKDDQTEPEKKLSEFRNKFGIEVFNEGKTYYQTAIKDQYIGYENCIQRNSVYQLTVNNVFNVGAQVPNGTPDKTALFYLDITVAVNAWVQNAYDVDLQ